MPALSGCCVRVGRKHSRKAAPKTMKPEEIWTPISPLKGTGFRA